MDISSTFSKFEKLLFCGVFFFFGMKVAALALVDGVTGKKQEIAWFCAFSEIGSQELH